MVDARQTWRRCGRLAELPGRGDADGESDALGDGALCARPGDDDATRRVEGGAEGRRGVPGDRLEDRPDALRRPDADGLDAVREHAERPQIRAHAEARLRSVGDVAIAAEHVEARFIRHEGRPRRVAHVADRRAGERKRGEGVARRVEDDDRLDEFADAARPVAAGAADDQHAPVGQERGGVAGAGFGEAGVEAVEARRAGGEHEGGIRRCGACGKGAAGDEHASVGQERRRVAGARLGERRGRWRQRGGRRRARACRARRRRARRRR